MKNIRTFAPLLVAALAFAGCDGSSTDVDLGFLGGTDAEPEIGLVVNSTEQSLTLFQVGNPTVQRQVSLGANQLISPTGFAVRGTRAVVPLGQAASVALINLQTQAIERFFTFPSGNATGSAWAGDNAVLVANLTGNYVGRFLVDQPRDSITQRSTQLVPGPTDIEVVGQRALVVSSNYDLVNFKARQGTLTALDASTLQVLGTLPVGLNPTDATLGPDGLLYLLNTGDYVAPSTLSIIDPQTLRLVATEERLFPGAGSISIDRNGIALISSFGAGTLAYNTRTRQFIRGTDNPICARTAEGRCRGASDATADARGNVYQTFFGSARRETKPWVFKYNSSYQLVDSIATGQGFYGPIAIDVKRF